jgi:hypothetical protein
MSHGLVRSIDCNAPWEERESRSTLRLCILANEIRHEPSKCRSGISAASECIDTVQTRSSVIPHKSCLPVLQDQQHCILVDSQFEHN